MKILHLSSGKQSSGAFRGAYLLHKNLLNLGIDSNLLKNHEDTKNSKTENVSTINNKIFNKLKSKIFFILEKLPKVFFIKREQTSFSNNFFGENILKNKQFEQADLIHFHWINNGFIDLEIIKKINKPIVWTLRDMWAFTGGCHYTLGCFKYKNKCSHCPQLGSNFKYDLSFLGHRKKTKNLKHKKITFCTISEWLADHAKESSILKDEKIINMNNHIDIENFFPQSKNISKKALNISTKKKIIVFGAENIEAKYKGFHKFVDSLNYLNKNDFMIIIFGKMWDFSEIEKKGFEYKYFGYVENKELLRNIYNSGDIFAISSIQDAFPKTFAEAMLCEIPVVAFENTSISKINLNYKTGYNAKNFDTEDFAKGIIYCCNHPKLGSLAREEILKNYNPLEITKKYINLYKKLLNEK